MDERPNLGNGKVESDIVTSVTHWDKSEKFFQIPKGLLGLFATPVWINKKIRYKIR